MAALRNGRPGPIPASRLPAIPTATPPPEKDAFFIRGVDGGDRMGELETRLGVTEKSNRALVEEVLRLHSELRVNVRRNEENIKDDRISRHQLEGNIGLVNDLLSKLSARIKATEDKLLEERSALSNLVTHTKGVEQAVLSSQATMTIKKDTQNSKLQEMGLTLGEMQRNRELLEKTVFQLTEELRATRSKVESQGVELSTTINDLRVRSRRLEEENKIQLDALRKQGEQFTSSETNTGQLRGQVETRLSELRDVVLELRSRADTEAGERRTLETHMTQRVNQLNQSLIEQNRKREESMHAMDMIHREKEHGAEASKLQLQGKMNESVEEMNKRLLNKEIKLREEMQAKFSHLEKVIQQEQLQRQKQEAAMKEEGERWREGVKKLADDDRHAIKDTFVAERQKNKEAVSKLDESISLLEKQLAEGRRQSDKVVAAEIKSRKHHEKTTKEQIDHLNEKLGLATSSLQTAMGGVTGSLQQNNDKMRAEMRAMVQAAEQTSTRSLTDMDARLTGVKGKLATLEQTLDTRISEAVGIVACPEALELNEATAILAQNLRDKVESISLWQDVTSQTIRELNTATQGVPNELFALEEKQKLQKNDFDSRLTSETDARLRDVENIKQELSTLTNRRQPQFATQEDLQELQGSVRKLAESIQSVKTVIGMKIQSEQKLRETDIKEVQDDLNALEKKVDDVTARVDKRPADPAPRDRRRDDDDDR